ncbi:MAG: SPOR domain-containing protein [Candidatus Competibacter sp.]|nr:SPOR domain-containing protein [Candidatus Competibacter sp.]MDG4605062.1 SPOR domain-containing protein [Candidatus Contendobacter sp.]HRD48384.1 SPOR domain-containing protein [Candidatus Contendobacter sp.]
MATLSWKSSTLLAATLLVALGLQAGAVKILLNLNRSPEAVTTAEDRAAPIKSTSPPLATAEIRRQPVTDPPPPSEATVAASTPKPTVAASDPPPPTSATASTEPNPEARLATTVAVPPAPRNAPKTPVSDPPPAATAPVEAVPRPAAGHSAPPTVAPTPVAPPSAEVATIKPAEPAAASGLRDAEWLKTRDPKNYTVQLYSGKDLDKLKEIAASTASTDPQAYFTTGSRASPWYSLVMGDYPDSAAARLVAAAIAARSTQIKPWVRRLDEIQANMR